MTCAHCSKPTAPAELAAYRGLCEDCYNRPLAQRPPPPPESRVVNRNRLSWSGRPGQFTCRNCAGPFLTRSGRGLCRACWDDVAIREMYPVLAPFGGDVAGAMAQKAFGPHLKSEASP